MTAFISNLTLFIEVAALQFALAAVVLAAMRVLHLTARALFNLVTR